MAHLGGPQPPECASGRLAIRRHAPERGLRSLSCTCGRIVHMRILVVDDDPAIRRSLERALSFEGHTVTCVENGAAAISEAIKPEAYDAMVLDLGLPDIDGLDVTRTIRVAGLDVPILVLTARGAVGDRVGVAEAPGEARIQRDVDDLLA